MIKGITFDEQTVAAANDGHIYNVLAQGETGITQGCNITSDSSNMYIDTGYMLICGRQVQVVSMETVPLETVSSGELYCKVVYQIDLTQTNTENDFLQGSIVTLTNSSGYPAVTQDDLDDGGTLYQYPLAQYHVTVGGADSFTDLTQDADLIFMKASQFRLVGTTLYID